MTHTFDSVGFFTFLVALAHGAPLILGAAAAAVVMVQRNKEQADLPFLHVMWEWEMQERHFQHILRKKIILILVTLVWPVAGWV